MADSVTINYAFVKPEVGASGNTWGGKANANYDSIDALIKALDFLSAAAKITPILADRVPIIDTEEDPDEVKYITFTQLKALVLAAVSLSDAIFEVVDNADATKKLVFQLSGVTAGQTRTLTIPDLSGTIALLTGAQTFTDKTFTQPIVILKQSAAEAPTADGDIRWDSDDNAIAVGDGVAARYIPVLSTAAAAGDLTYLTAAKALGRLAKSTKGKVLRQNSAEDAPEWGGHGPDAVLEDQKASGSNGGTFNSGAWQQRDLNTEVLDTFSVITVGSNQFTPSVNGWAEWSCPASQVDSHQSRLFNVTDAVAVGYGQSCHEDDNNFGVSMSVGSAPVIAGKTYRVEHRSSGGQNTTGFGRACGFGNVEVYTRVKFWIT